MEIYIKPEKKLCVSEIGDIKLSDIAKIYAPKHIKDSIGNLTVLSIKSKEKRCYLISVIDIIRLIDNAQPGHSVVNVGETDTVVELNPPKDKPNSFFSAIKTIAVTIVLLAGSATAIMCFHSEVQMTTVLENYYYIFFGERVTNPAIIDIPYSVGLALGIIVFYNHFCGKKLTIDPTPIEVEMTQYDDEVTKNIVDNLSSEEKTK